MCSASIHSAARCRDLRTAAADMRSRERELRPNGSRVHNIHCRGGHEERPQRAAEHGQRLRPSDLRECVQSVRPAAPTEAEGSDRESEGGKDSGEHGDSDDAVGIGLRGH